MIECKNEATADIISKSYADKSAGRRHWFEATYGPGCQADSVMVHPSGVVSHYAAPDPHLRIMTLKKLEELKAAVRALARSIANSGMSDVVAIGKAVDYLNLSAAKLVPAFTEAFAMQPKPPR